MGMLALANTTNKLDI